MYTTTLERSYLLSWESPSAPSIALPDLFPICAFDMSRCHQGRWTRGDNGMGTWEAKTRWEQCGPG
jgi:hypothetical protein